MKDGKGVVAPALEEKPPLSVPEPKAVEEPKEKRQKSDSKAIEEIPKIPKAVETEPSLSPTEAGNLLGKGEPKKRGRPKKIGNRT